MHNYDSADIEFSAAMALDSSNIESYLNLASVRFYKREYDASKELIEKSQSLDPNAADAYNLLGLISLEFNESGPGLAIF